MIAEGNGESAVDDLDFKMRPSHRLRQGAATFLSPTFARCEAAHLRKPPP